MRRAKVLLLAACMLGLPARAGRLALAPGDEVPYLMGFDVFNGETQPVTWAAGKVTLVNFWATWCEPCRKEMPQLQKLHERFEKDGLRVVGVTKEDASFGDLQQFVYAVGATFLTIRTPGRVATAWGGVGTLPTTFMVDDKGRLIRRYVGFTEQQSEALAQDVENVLAGKPLGPVVLSEQSEVVSEDLTE